MFKLAVKQNTNGEPQSEEDVSSLVDGIETLEELGETATKERLSSLLEKERAQISSWVASWL